ncbi:helix-turn-helix domain-containing protein [Niallia sp. Sow4_A1]|jgi:excisionase family DNA binding protein|uniref:Helix-turn-helix domain-containing protein n=1 Tax=Niallia hominis TaxID=3133173 RepID=A0ABV1F750_9BACI|nr:MULTISPECIES: helix-turn-helix domain-containing protein [Bacillaceae]MCF2650699.1 helix-turn-helix domain-containing protein [Niallia circulans]MCM3363612.1 helix-turn-helix domain-containing protein [Niallia sp. MER TA 168]REB76418.1 DNA-binding protein [Cutibacterium acnes]CAI9391302.1 hypothetical protein BACSP_02958 [Bacillus sp. T2.9-1]
MINEGESRIADVIHDLEEVLKGTKEKEQSLRLQKAINTLKEHSVTVRLKDTTITFLAENADDVVSDSEASYHPITSHAVKPVVIGLSEETIDENGVRYIDTKTVADYYGVSTETVRNWIKDGKISGKQLSNRGKWFIPAEEFEYLKEQRENDDTEGEIAQLLGEDFGDDWEVELAEE